MTREEMRFDLAKASMLWRQREMPRDEAVTASVRDADAFLAALGAKDEPAPSWHEAKEDRLRAAESVVARLDAEIAKNDRIVASRNENRLNACVTREISAEADTLRRIRRGDDIQGAAATTATPRVAPEVATTAGTAAPFLSAPPAADAVDAVLREFGSPYPASASPGFRALAAEVARLRAEIDAEAASACKLAERALTLRLALLGRRRQVCASIVRDATGGTLAALGAKDDGAVTPLARAAAVINAIGPTNDDAPDAVVAIGPAAKNIREDLARLDEYRAVVARLDATIAGTADRSPTLLWIRRGDESNKGAATITAEKDDHGIPTGQRGGSVESVRVPQTAEPGDGGASRARPHQVRGVGAVDTSGFAGRAVEGGRDHEDRGGDVLGERRDRAREPGDASLTHSAPPAADVDSVLSEFTETYPQTGVNPFRLAAEVARLRAALDGSEAETNRVQAALTAERSRCASIVREATGGSIEGMVAAIEGGAP